MSRADLPTAPLRGARYALLLVCLTQAMSLLDRQILAILAPAIKADLKIGDAEMGMLYGTVFALFYALFSLPVGRLADGWARTRLLAICLVAWSAATALAGFASSFALLALSRLGVGIGEAATQPAGNSLVCDYWPRGRRGFAMACIAAAIALGLGGSIMLGGVAAHWWDSRQAGAAHGLAGWQFAFLVAAAPGFLLAIFLYRLREPPRGTLDGIESQPDPAPFAASVEVFGAILPGTSWLFLARREASRTVWLANFACLAGIAALAVLLARASAAFAPRPPLAFGPLAIDPHALQRAVIGFGLYVLVNLAQWMKLRDPVAFRVIAGNPTALMAIAVIGLQSVINYGVMGFTPLFLIRTYHLEMKDVAVLFGLLAAALGVAGPLLAGPVADRLHARFPNGGRAWLTIFALGLSPFLSLWVYSSPGPTAFYWRFVLYSLVLTMWLPPLYSLLYDQVMPRMRGITTSIYLMAMTILGLGIGPYLVGLISDATGDLGFAIRSINWVAPAIVLLLLLVARRAGRDERALQESALPVWHRRDGAHFGAGQGARRER